MSLTSSKIYVAGHTGLLGSALMKKLKAGGFVNVVTKKHSELDLTQQQAVDDFFRHEQPEYVFMAAALTGGIVGNRTFPATFLHTNFAIQDNLFEAAHKYGVKHFFYYASSCTYPKESRQPIKEEYLMTGAIEETSEAYAIAKIAGIIACKSYNNQFKTKRFVALLPNSMYGPNDHFEYENNHVIPAMITKFHDAKMAKADKMVLWGSGTPRREFIFSEDVADASLFAMMNADRLENSHYNIGTGIDCTTKELATRIAEVVGFKGDILWDTSKPDGPKRKLFDSSRFLGLGWKPSVTLEQGLEATYKWYLNSQQQEELQ